MKKVIFKSISLLNFKGIRDLHADFGEDLTIISGKNAAGKTSIADAIMWVLFGTDYKGDKLEPKTFDKDHNIIPEISHEAELTLSVDGDEIVLKRTLSDAWNGDKCSNTYKYYVDGDVTTAKDFKKAVDDICNETTFRLTSSSTAFLSMPWADQRKFLQVLVPEITTDEITRGDVKFDFVTEALKKESIDKLIHHIKYNRGEVQKQLDDIPTRLKELDKALPDKIDWESIQKAIDEKAEELVEISGQLSSINNGGAEQVRKDGIRSKIEFARKRKENMEKSARNLASENITKHESDLLTASEDYHKANSIVEDLKAKMRGITQTEVHVKAQVEECKKGVKDLNQQMMEINSRHWEWNDDDSFCPHCGQPYPLDRLQELKRESHERFNNSIATAKKRLQEKFVSLQEEYTNAKNLLEQNDKDQQSTLASQKDALKTLNNAEVALEKVKQETPKGYVEILQEKEEYQQVVGEIEELNRQLEEPVEEEIGNASIISDLADKKNTLEDELYQLREKLATKHSYDRIISLKEQAEKEKQAFKEQLDELDKRLDIASEYQQLSCSLLEEEVNKCFKFVRWSLFKTNLDGEKKPFCECYHDGVPYSRLNGAAKVNAGIDIAYTIAEFYDDISVPMILDECESNLHPITKEGHQQIRFYVSHDEELKIEWK